MEYKNGNTKLETEEQEKEISLQVLKVIGLTVLIIGYILVALSEIGELNELLSNKNKNSQDAVVKDLFF